MPEPHISIIGEALYTFPFEKVLGSILDEFDGLETTYLGECAATPRMFSRHVYDFSSFLNG